MAIGPLIKVKTQIAAVNQNVSRLLNYGKDSLEFIIVDTTTDDNWKVVQTVTKGFNRIASDEETLGTGHLIVFKVSNIKENAAITETIKLKDLFIRTKGEIFSVESVPKIAPNVSQVYTFNCRERTNRSKVFNK